MRLMGSYSTQPSPRLLLVKIGTNLLVTISILNTRPPKSDENLFYCLDAISKLIKHEVEEMGDGHNKMHLGGRGVVEDK